MKKQTLIKPINLSNLEAIQEEIKVQEARQEMRKERIEQIKARGWA